MSMLMYVFQHYCYVLFIVLYYVLFLNMFSFLCSKDMYDMWYARADQTMYESAVWTRHDSAV